MHRNKCETGVESCLLKSKRIALCIAAAFTILTLAINLEVHAKNNTDTKSENNQYYFKSISARNAYRLIAANTKTTIEISPSVVSRLKNIRLTGSQEEIFNQIADVTNTDWFDTGKHVFISSADERISRLIRLETISASYALEKLEGTKLISSRFPFTKSEDDNILIVSAPPKYIAYVETFLKSEVDSSNSPAPMKKSSKTTGSIKIIKYGYTYRVPIE